jgi:DNA excision repair protein ERCC-1
MVPDYILSSQRCALFLSIKYHNLHPEYIHRRIAELKTDFKLRILLVLIDVEDNANTLLQLNKIAVVHSLTLILAWSEEEAARYLETYKAFDGKDATMIQKREQTNFVDQVADVLGTIRSVNKTDSAQLLSQFGSIKAIMAASVDELVLCPGVGEKKVRRMFEAFHKPFSSKRAKERKEKAEGENDDQSDNNAETETIPEAAENPTSSTDKQLDDTTNLNAETHNGTIPPAIKL